MLGGQEGLFDQEFEPRNLPQVAVLILAMDFGQIGGKRGSHMAQIAGPGGVASGEVLGQSAEVAVAHQAADRRKSGLERCGEVAAHRAAIYPEPGRRIDGWNDQGRRFIRGRAEHGSEDEFLKLVQRGHAR